MKHKRTAKACALVFVFAAAVLLSGWTLADFVQAHEPLREFRIRFVSLHQTDDPQRFDATFLFENRSLNAPVEMDFMNFSISYRGETIASDAWFPDDFQVGAGAEVERVIALKSQVAESRLVDLKEDAGLWEARGTLRIRRPGAQRKFPIHMRQAPAVLQLQSSDRQH